MPVRGKVVHGNGLKGKCGRDIAFEDNEIIREQITIGVDKCFKCGEGNRFCGVDDGET